MVVKSTYWKGARKMDADTLSKDDFIVIQNQSYIKKIKLKDIMYIQRQGRKLKVVAEDTTYFYYERMENFYDLPKPPFYFPLKGLCINLENILSMENQKIIFENGEYVYIGRDGFIRSKQMFHRYLMR